MNDTLKNIQNMIQTFCNENFNSSFDPDNPKIKLHETTFAAEEIFAATKVMLSTNVTMGEKVLDFENEFSKKFNGKQHHE